MGYTIRKEMGTRSIRGKNKRMGYALYKDGKPVYPKCRNWWPTKKEAERVMRSAKGEAKAKKRIKKRTPRRYKKK